MLHKSRGIILKSTPYSESSLVVHIYTEKFGIQSYLLQGVKKNKSKIRTSMIQPLHLVQMVVYHKENGGLQRVSELKNDPVLNHLSSDVIKTSVSLFICELLYQTLKEQPADEALFEFIFKAIELLDLTENSVSNFHIWFMLRYTKYLGFFPQASSTSPKYFDMKNAEFVEKMPDHPLYINENCTTTLFAFTQSTFEEIQNIRIAAETRKQLLMDLIRYYEWHLPNFKGLKSHHILEEVLN